jgi:hypothetical protein
LPVGRKKALADVLAMPWGGDRNMALRRVLGVEMGMVDRSGVVLAVCANREDARRVDRLLSRVVATTRWRRPDGKWVVAGMKDGG